MSFAQAKVVARDNPGSVITRDSAGQRIVRLRDGSVIWSENQSVSSATPAPKKAKPKPRTSASQPKKRAAKSNSPTSVTPTDKPKPKRTSAKKTVTKKSASNEVTQERTKKSYLDPFTAALAVGIEQVKNGSDPLLEQAIEMTTSRPLDELIGDPDALQGVINAAKGKYFELLVQEDFRDGVEYESLSLNSGGDALLAEKLNQPGWDLQITDSAGTVLDEVQLKATDSINYLRDTLERYPDISILSTSEVAGFDEFQSRVIDSGMSNAELTEKVTSNLSSLDPDFLDAFNPLLPLVVILASEGVHVALGKQSQEDITERLVERTSKSVTGTVVGTAFLALGFGWLSVVPAFFAAREGPEGLIELAEEFFRKETPEEARQRRQEDADVTNRMLRERGLEGNYIAETAPNSAWTGIAAVDNFVRPFIQGKNAAATPEMKALRAKYQEKRESEIRDYLNGLIKD